jgi:hypothetical protein
MIDGVIARLVLAAVGTAEVLAGPAGCRTGSQPLYRDPGICGQNASSWRYHAAFPQFALNFRNE